MKKVFLSSCNTTVGSNLEYSVQFCLRYYRKAIEKLERIQRKAAEMVSRLRNKPHEERLKELNLFSFSKRGLRDDLPIFKITCAFSNVNFSDYLVVDHKRTTTRSYSFKIIGKKKIRTHEPNNFFNSVTVCSNTIVLFENRLDNLITAPNFT